MKSISMPGTDLTVSKVALGGSDLGSRIDREASFALLDAFIEGGGNCIDTALVYADWIPGTKSLSEKTIGAWMKERGNREQLVLMTKGGHPYLSSMHIPRLSREEIISDLNESLHHLGVETIDLYWLHRDDPARPVGEIIETMNELVQSGKIRYFGCSNWSTERIREATRYAERHQLAGFAASQLMWNLAVVNQETVDPRHMAILSPQDWEYYCAAGMTVFAYTSQARGFFSKAAKGGLSCVAETVRRSYENPQTMARLEQVMRLAEESAIPVSTVVLAYLTNQPFPAVPIVGPQSIPQLSETLMAAGLELPKPWLIEWNRQFSTADTGK